MTDFKQLSESGGSFVATSENWGNRALNLTKRELFAAMAMQGILMDEGAGGEQAIAEWAVSHADALLKELAK